MRRAPAARPAAATRGATPDRGIREVGREIRVADRHPMSEWLGAQVGKLRTDCRASSRADAARVAHARFVEQADLVLRRGGPATARSWSPSSALRTPEAIARSNHGSAPRGCGPRRDERVAVARVEVVLVARLVAPLRDRGGARAQLLRGLSPPVFSSATTRTRSKRSMPTVSRAASASRNARVDIFPRPGTSNCMKVRARARDAMRSSRDRPPRRAPRGSSP